jgi:NTE family protein
LRERAFHGDATGLLAFLAKAPVEQLIARSKVTQFSRGTPVCAGDQLVECAYLLLDGTCEHRPSPTDSEPPGIIRRGETFGLLPDRKLIPEESVVVATTDSVVLGIRRKDLSELMAGVNESEAVASAPKPDHSGTSFFFKAPSGKLTVLAHISADLPTRLITNQLARGVHAETGESVVQVQFIAETDELWSPSASAAWNEISPLLNIVPQNENGVASARVAVGIGTPSNAALSGLLQRLRRRFQHVLVEVVADQFPVERLTACMAQAGKAVFFLRRTEQDLYHLDLLLHELRPRVNGHLPSQLKPVLCLAAGERAGGFDARLAPTGMSVAEFLHECPSPLAAPATSTGRFARDLRRLARDIGDCLIGLALSSGGAKGFAHIGVIQVLEENNIEVDVIAGSSMGAYVGALHAFGCDGAKLEQLAREMEVRWALWSLIDPVFPPRQGFIRGDAVEHRLKRTLGDAEFSDLVCPVRIVATSLNTLERVVFSSGPVSTAVRASTSVPGVCVPLRIGDESYIDGGIVDPLPTDVLHEMGIRRIIAVNTVGTSDQIRRQLLLGRERKRRERKGELQQLTQHLNYFAPGNILEILMTSIHGAQLRVAEASGRLASVVLHPETATTERWLDFRNPGHHIAAGRAVALAQLTEIKRAIQLKGASHERETSRSFLAAAA